MQKAEGKGAARLCMLVLLLFVRCMKGRLTLPADRVAQSLPLLVLPKP